MRARRFLAAVGLLAAIAAAGVARAGPKPHIDSLDPAEAAPGGNIVLVGENFGDDMQAVTAKVGDQKTNVLLCEPTRLQIGVPIGLKKGKVKVSVTIGEVKANDKELLILDAEGIAAKRKKDGEKESPTGGETAKMFSLDAPTVQSDRGNTIVIVTGRSDLPAECEISLKLSLGDSGSLKLGNDAGATVGEDHRFQAKIGPFPKPLAPGRYWVDADFNLSEQPKKIRRAFELAFKDEGERRKRERCRDRKPLDVGSSGDQDAQVREMKSHETGTIAKLRQLHRELEVAFGAALRSKFKKGKDVDEAAWEDRLDGKSLQGLDAPVRAAWVKEMKARSEFLTSGGAFAEPKWREWLDGKFTDDLAEVGKANASVLDRFLVVKDRPILEMLQHEIDYLGKLARYRSHELYEVSGLPLAPQDGEPQSGLSGAQIEGNLKSIETRVAATGGGPLPK